LLTQKSTSWQSLLEVVVYGRTLPTTNTKKKQTNPKLLALNKGREGRLRATDPTFKQHFTVASTLKQVV
jgi:hypothetical protein